MTVLVTAATKNRSTGEIAQAIGAVLTDRGVAAVVMPPDDVRDIGKLDKKDVGPVQRIGLALFGMQGDFRHWGAIRTWSAGIADALHETPTG